MAARVWIDGRPIDALEARVPVFDRGFLYGDSVYEVTRTFGGKPFALEEHLDRLDRSAAGIGMTLPTRAEIVSALDATLASAGERDAYIRIIVTRGAGEIGLDPAMADRPRLIIIVKPVQGPPASAYEEGVEVAIVHKSRAGQTVDPSVKSGNYLPSVLGLGEARQRGAYEAILCDREGHVTEGSSSNFFLVRQGRVVTPPLSIGLLEGITRAKVIKLARGAGMDVDETALWPEDFGRAEEAFLTSSVRGVVPIVRVDGRAVGDGRPGVLTRKLMALYDELTRQAGA